MERRLGRRALVMIVLVSCILPLSGCSDAVDINRRVLVTTIGFDVADAPGEIEVTVHFFPLSGSAGAATELTGGGGGGPTASPSSASYSASGSSLTGVAGELRRQAPGQLYLGSLQLIAVGRRLSHEQLKAAVDYLIREPYVVMHVPVVSVDGSVSQFLSRRPQFGDSPAEHVEKLLGGSSQPNAAFEPMHLFDLVNGVYSPNSTVVSAPLIKMGSTGSEIAGLDILQGGRFVQAVPPSDAPFVALVGRSKPTVLVCPPLSADGSPIGLRLPNAEITSELDLKNGKVKVRFSGQAFVVENATGLSVDDGGMRVSEHVNRCVKQRLERFLTDMYGRSVDVLRLGERLALRGPGGALPPDWRGILARLTFAVESNILILHGFQGR